MRKEVDPWNSQDREFSQWRSSRFRKILSLKKISQKVIEENAPHICIHVYISVHAHINKCTCITHTHKNILMYKVTSSVFFEIEC